MKRRYKTVELIVEEAAWEPQAPDETPMAIRVGGQERAAQRQNQTNGWTMGSQRKAWNLSHKRVVALGLQDRVIGRWEGPNREWHSGA